MSSPLQSPFPYCTSFPPKGDYQCASLHLFLLFHIICFAIIITLGIHGWLRKRHPFLPMRVQWRRREMDYSRPFLPSLSPSFSSLLAPPPSTSSSTARIVRVNSFLAQLWVEMPFNCDCPSSSTHNERRTHCSIV